MAKTLKSYERTTIKNVARSVYPFKARIESIDAKIQSLEEEKKEVLDRIDMLEAPVVSLTGYTSSDLVKRTLVPTPKGDGTFTNSAKYEFIYPDTIIPEETQEMEEGEPENSEENV